MSGFDPIIVKFGGVEKSIPANDFFPTLSAVEEHITFDRLNEIIVAMQNKSGMRVGVICGGYFCLLRRAGFKVTEKEVLHSITSGVETSSAIESLVYLFKQLMSEEATTPQKKPIAKKARKAKS